MSKLKWYKESRSSRHLEDAESVLKISGAHLDMNYLSEWGKKLGIMDSIEKLGL